MSKFGGGTKFGGGALFGGGSSVYEAWRETIWDLWGRGAFERSRGDETKNISKLISTIASQYEGAEIDAERIRSEGLAGLSIESLDDWAQIFRVERSNTNDDTMRILLSALQANCCNYTTATRLASFAEDMMTDTDSGRVIEAYVHQCTMAQCTATDNSGDGCRYVAVLVPFWVWERYRPWFRAIQEYCDRSDSYYGETTVCCSNTNEPMDKDNALGAAEPAFYCNKSIIDRDVVRD